MAPSALWSTAPVCPAATTALSAAEAPADAASEACDFPISTTARQAVNKPKTASASRENLSPLAISGRQRSGAPSVRTVRQSWPALLPPAASVVDSSR